MWQLLPTEPTHASSVPRVLTHSIALLNRNLRAEIHGVHVSVGHVALSAV